MKRTAFLFILFLFSIQIFAQSKKEQDIAAIKNMCGCYEITFEYAETFSPDTAYKLAKPYKAKALEWATIAEESKNKIAIQHLLLAMDTMVIKHWRQDWLYENTSFFAYQQDLTWAMIQLEKKQVTGQWTQNVYEVDDSPRYSGSATWIHADGRHFWENTTNAPLPRREYTKRSDYQVLKRRNRHEITDFGWVHEQDNQKNIRNSSGEKLLAQEKGMNTYLKVADSRCQKAKDWWQKSKQFWNDVRNVWEETLNKSIVIDLKRKVEDKFLGEHLENLAKNPSTNSQENQEKIKMVMTKYQK
ncbi:MAG: hypothetical protein EAZ97_09880 [Bacteroidetes bacterium]|nr:MAG: hypothetical protein EAZ97_09880 [Bacteroidota bacterium]